MEDHQNPYKKLLAENKYLKAKLDSIMNHPEQQVNSAMQTQSSEKFSDHLKTELETYAHDLLNIDSKELFPLIISKAKKIIEVNATIISTYEEETSKLKIEHTSFSESDRSMIESLVGSKLNALKISLSKDQYQLICKKPFRLIPNLHELTFGAIPEPKGKIVELTMGFGFFIQMGLIHHQKLIGTIILIGSKDQFPPAWDDLNLFCSLTANAVSRKIAEEALVEGKARSRRLIDEAPFIYQSLDHEGKYLDVNPAWLKKFGYQPTEVIGKWMADFLTEKSKAVFLEDFKLFGIQGKINCELEFLTKDGNVLIVESDFQTGNDYEGNFRQTYCILRDVTEQRKAEDKIREREEVFEAIANYMANWESWFDNSGKIIWTNPASFRFTGYTPDEIISIPDYINTLVAEHDRERVAVVFREALEGKDQSSVEFTCVRKDKSEFRINVAWNHIYDKNGKELGIRSSGHDITSHKQAQEAVSQSEGLYKQMIDNTPFGMHFYQLTDDGRLIFTSANHAAKKILGIDHSQFIGLTIEEAFPSLVGTKIISHYAEAARNNTIYETEQIVYSDERISGAFEVKAFQTLPGQMVAIFTDITNRKKAEDALNKSQHLFEALTRVSPVGIFRTDRNGETTYVNPMWTSLTGLSFKDALESKYLTALHPEDKDERVAEWRIAVQEGKTVVSEYRFLRPDGSIVWVQGHAVPEIIDNKINGYIGTITDISDLKRAEEELLKAKEKAEASNRLKTTFMGNISHEIRTPLNGIIGFAELISSGNNSSEENQECIEFLSHSINRLTKIIDNIMDVSMMMSGNTTVKNETFPIDPLLNEIYLKYELTATRKNLNFFIVNTGKSHGSFITSDKSLINRITCELVDNAIKFTNKGEVKVSYQVNNNILSLCVCDSGVGITKEFLPFIFEPFIQEDVYSARLQNSNGLGLSIVHEAVNMLGGEVTAESAPGSGSSFTVTIPVIESEKDIIYDSRKENTDNSERMPVILIVEDEEINMIYLKRLLSQKGYPLLLASNAPDAIGIIEKGGAVDLILMDMKMPGMDGFEATRRIREIAPAVKIAAVTAYASEADRDACIEAGCDDYIAKPFQKNDLYKLLVRMKF